MRWVLACALGLGACRGEDTSVDHECARAADNLAKLSKAESRRPKHARAEHRANVSECKASWSKERASCVANAKTQNEMIRCRGFRNRQWSENFRSNGEAK